MRLPLVVALIVAAGSTAGASGCRQRAESERERREAAIATAALEEKAQEATLTSSTLETEDDAREAEGHAIRAQGEMIAAFRLEQGDYRTRLRQAIDGLDKDVARAQREGARSDGTRRALQSQRERLKADLAAVDRSTEPDWATLRTRVDADLDVEASRNASSRNAQETRHHRSTP